MGCSHSKASSNALTANLTEDVKVTPTSPPVSSPPTPSPKETQNPPPVQVPKKEADKPVESEVVQSVPKGVNDSESEAFGLLLCGSGESGKTTYTRQLRLKYLGGFEEREKNDFIATIRGNLIDTMQTLFIWLEHHSLVVEDEVREAFEFIGEIDAFNCEYDDEICQNLKALWEDAEIQNAFNHRDETPIPDHMDYFFQKIDVLFSDDYVPTNEDVLKARIRTIGISEVTINMDDALVRIYDVGGQKNERSKWERVMKKVNGVIYCVSFADFDKPMFEDQTVLRMDDAIQIFEGITHRENFQNSPFFLLCNKFDIFREKIMKTDKFGKVYPDFKGDIHDPEQCTEHIVNIFLEKAGNSSTRPINVHRIVALNQDSVTEVTSKICKFIRDNYYE